VVLITLPHLRFARFCAIFFASVAASIPCFAQHAFVPVNSTPYDKQMARILPVLGTGAHYAPDPLLLTRVNGWINDLYSIPYAYCPHWNTPVEVQSAPFADCKGKAVALYVNMKSYGATNLRIVIGKRRVADFKTHAWLEWQTKNGKYLLDPTFNEMAPETTWTNPSAYIPFYAYDGAHKYRADNHRSSTVVTQNLVATRYAASYRAVSYGPPSWTTAQSFNQSAGQAPTQIQKLPVKRTANRSNAGKVAVQPSQVQHPASSHDLQKRRVAGWKHLSAPNVAGVD
jgi:hypothetical protein